MTEVVSVIIPYSPAHTPEEMLTEAKESVKAQSPQTELVVVEDTEQRGPAWARNVGLDRAETRYVAFLDADDLWAPDKLKRQLDRMDETGAGLCVEGNEMTTEEFVRKLFVGELASLTPSILLDTEQVDVRFEESLERREDHLFMLEAAQQGGVCLCNDIVTIRKQESGLSASTNSSLRLEADLQFLSLACRRVPVCKQYFTEYYHRFYHHHGRLKHAEGDFREAVSYLAMSLRFGLRLRTLAAFWLSLFWLCRQFLTSLFIDNRDR